MLTGKKLQKLAFLLQERKLEKIANFSKGLLRVGTGAAIGGGLGLAASKLDEHFNPADTETSKTIRNRLVGVGALLGAHQGLSLHKKQQASERWKKEIDDLFEDIFKNKGY